MKREPLWMRINRRPSWERNDPPRLSDFDPWLPVHAAVNRMIQREQALLARLDALLARRREP